MLICVGAMRSLVWFGFSPSSNSKPATSWTFLSPLRLHSMSHPLRDGQSGQDSYQILGQDFQISFLVCEFQQLQIKLGNLSIYRQIGQRIQKTSWSNIREWVIQPERNLIMKEILCEDFIHLFVSSPYHQKICGLGWRDASVIKSSHCSSPRIGVQFSAPTSQLSVTPESSTHVDRHAGKAPM